MGVRLVALLAGAATMLLGVAAGVPSARAIEVPGTNRRVIVQGYLDGLAVAPTEDSGEQLPQAILDLRADGTLNRVLRAHLELQGAVGGPFDDPTPGVFNFVHTFQEHAPSLEFSEAWVEARASRADLRVGLQKFAWGKLDALPPTDVLNPSDLHDPFVRDAEERKIGVPAVAANLYGPDLPRLALTNLRLGLIGIPLAVPSRLAVVEDRWFPSSVETGTDFSLPARKLPAELRPFLPHGLDIPVSLGTESRRPPLTLDAGGVGLRLSGTWRESDWDLYHYTGPETGPNVDMLAEVRGNPALVERLAFAHAFRAAAVLRQAHDTIHMTGADLGTAIGGATVRAEIAHFDDRPYLRIATDLVSPEAFDKKTIDRIVRRLENPPFRARVPLGDLFVERDAITWGIGADYLFHGALPVVQVIQTILLEPAPPLVIHDPETQLSGGIVRPFLEERLVLEARGMYEIEREAWFLFPRASYLVRDDLRVRLGYLALGGPRASLVGQFRQNDELVVQARYTF